MKIYAFLLVLLSAFCAAFARYDLNGAERRLATTTGGSRALTASRGLKSVTTAPLKDVEDSEDDKDEDEEDKPDTEDDFDSDVESIDGEDDSECPTGKYTLKYISKERFASGKKYKMVKTNNLHACGARCAKSGKKKCGTFNWNKKSKQCQMFTTKDIGRAKAKDSYGTAAFLACID